MAATGKRLKKAYEGLDPAAPPVKLDEAVKQIKSRASAKLEAGETAIMAQWAVGRRVRIWKSSIASLLKAGPPVR